MSSSEAGRSAVRRGIAWQRTIAQLCRAWWPHADHSGTGGPTVMRRTGDISGIGDRIVECTVQPMENLAGKLRQAESDAIRAGYPEYWVVKKAVREPAGRAYMIGRVEVVLPLLARLDRLEGMLDDVYQQGFIDAREEMT